MGGLSPPLARRIAALSGRLTSRSPVSGVCPGTQAPFGARAHKRKEGYSRGPARAPGEKLNRAANLCRARSTGLTAKIVPALTVV